MKVLVKKMVTRFEFQVIDYNIPEHGDHVIGNAICECKNCMDEVISLAIKKDDWYCNDDEYETKFETETN